MSTDYPPRRVPEGRYGAGPRLGRGALAALAVAGLVLVTALVGYLVWPRPPAISGTLVTWGAAGPDAEFFTLAVRVPAGERARCTLRAVDLTSTELGSTTVTVVGSQAGDQSVAGRLQVHGNVNAVELVGCSRV